MRLLLSFLVGSFFLLASHRSDAAGWPTKYDEATTVNGVSQKDRVEYSQDGHKTLTLFRLGNIRSATNQHRPSPSIHADDVRYSFAAASDLLAAKRLQKRSTDCIPIQLKLLFPKHYFW